MITADNILDSIKEIIQDGKKIPSEKWMSASFSLNTLIMDEIEKLENLRLELARLTNGYMEPPEAKSAARAKVMAMATTLYKDMRMQEAKVEQIKQFIMIAKQNASNFT